MKSFASIQVARDADDVETCVFFFAFCFGLLSPSYQGAPRPPSGICPSAAACVSAGVSWPDGYYCVKKKKFMTAWNWGPWGGGGARPGGRGGGGGGAPGRGV